MTTLPFKQVGKGQRLAPQAQVEPNAKVMQGHFGCQTGLKAREVMRPFASQPKGSEQFVIDRLNDLAQSGQPAPPLFGPVLLAALMRSGDDFCSVALAPLGLGLLSGKAFIRQIDPLSRASHTAQTSSWPRSCGKHGLRQPVIVRTGRSKTKAGNDAVWVDGTEQVKPFIPAQAGTPADVGLPGQPAGALPLGIAGGDARTVQHLIQT